MEENEPGSLHHCLEEKLLAVIMALDKTTTSLWGWRGEGGVRDEEDVIDTMTKNKMVKVAVTE